MTIELYVVPPSPRAFKVVTVARHLGIDFTQHLISFRTGEMRTPEYAALNPNMRMPTLKDGDYVLWESEAIVQYLALQRPERGLLPADGRARLDVTRWQFWNLAHWDSACVVFTFEYVVKPRVLGDNKPDEAALAKGAESFHRAAKVLDGQLKGRKFITGDTLTLADFSLAAMLILAEPAHFPLEPYGEIKRWHATLAKLPAWQTTLSEAALPSQPAAAQ
jgi:glutathione S-transferase